MDEKVKQEIEEIFRKFAKGQGWPDEKVERFVKDSIELLGKGGSYRNQKEMRAVLKKLGKKYGFKV